MNEIQVTENNAVEAAEEAMKATSGKGWIVAGVIAGAAAIAGVICLVVKKAKAKKAEKLIEASYNEVEDEDEDFVEAE